MISPSNGRVVWYHPTVGEGIAQHDTTKPLAAIVAHVWMDRMVNLTVFDSNGHTHQRTSVKLLQDDDPPPNYAYAEWMPFQKGQAAKVDAAEGRKS